LSLTGQSWLSGKKEEQLNMLKTDTIRPAEETLVNRAEQSSKYQFEYARYPSWVVVMPGRDQVLHHGARREPIPGGSGSAPASHVPVMQYLITPLFEYRATSFSVAPKRRGKKFI